MTCACSWFFGTDFAAINAATRASVSILPAVPPNRVEAVNEMLPSPDVMVAP